MEKLSPNELEKSILQTMSEIILLLPNAVNKGELLNGFIDGFVAIKQRVIEKSPNTSAPIIRKMEDTLVSIVDFYNNGEISSGDEVIEQKLIPYYWEFKNLLKNSSCSKIIICGINAYSPMFAEKLKEQEFEIIGFLNYPLIDVEEVEIEGIPVLTFGDLNEYEFDFIIIMSEQHKEVESFLGKCISSEKVINYVFYAKEFSTIYNKLFMNNYEFSFMYSNIQNAINNNNYETLITGMSYSLHGIDTTVLERKGVKLCWSSQDLYYDLLLTKKVVNQNPNYKYCIMGMSYFSFNMDLSKLKSQSTLIDQIYYPLLNDAHHYSLADSYTQKLGVNQIDKFINLPEPFDSVELMKAFVSLTNLTVDSELHEALWNRPCENIPLDWLGKKRARLHGKANYPDTVRENVEIIKSYLALLTENNIKPIVIIFPTSHLYYPYLNPDMKKQFYDIMNILKLDYEFKIYDYFDSQLFSLSDFADADHLNRKGALKMTSIINKIII